MDALRATQKKLINDSEALPLSKYNFEQALNDALIYDDDGTVHTALLSVAATAGKQKTDAEKDLTNPNYQNDGHTQDPSSVSSPLVAPNAPAAPTTTKPNIIPH